MTNNSILSTWEMPTSLWLLWQESQKFMKWEIWDKELLEKEIRDIHNINLNFFKRNSISIQRMLVHIKKEFNNSCDLDRSWCETDEEFQEFLVKNLLSDKKILEESIVNNLDEFCEWVNYDKEKLKEINAKLLSYYDCENAEKMFWFENNDKYQEFIRWRFDSYIAQKFISEIQADNKNRVAINLEKRNKKTR